MDTNIQSAEPVIIIGLNMDQEDYEYSMEELAALAEANQMEVIDRLDQALDRPNPATYFGSGKVEELRHLAEAEEVATVIANDELTPSQLQNLADQTGVRILDRTALILEIFAKRAQSREAKIQVEIAQLQYQLPRLQTAANQRLDQHLRAELKEIAKSEDVKRAKREKSDTPTAALVGYTNAGKSTIMNQLVSRFGVSEEKQVFEKNMLFATLDTSVRQLTLPDQKRFLLSDTVGFVSKLPTHLIEAFKSTLAEAASADLLIQVIDYSDPNYEAMMCTTEKTLKQIGIENIPMLYVFNKADQTEFEYPVMEGDNRIIISAKDDESIQLLVQALRRHLFKDYVQTELLIPFADGRTVSYINENCNILETEYLNNGTRLKVEMSPQDFARFERYVIKN